MTPTRQVEHCNQLLIELGQHPKYEWRWSDSLTLPLPARWEESETGLAVPREPRAERIAPDLRGQWVVAYLQEIGSAEDWARMFPAGQVLYPGRSMWIPLSTPGGWIAMKPGLDPTDAATREFIGVIRRMRAKTVAATLAADLAAGAEKAEEAKRLRIDKNSGILDPLLPVRQWIPGSRSYPVWQRRASEERMIVD